MLSGFSDAVVANVTQDGFATRMRRHLVERPWVIAVAVIIASLFICASVLSATTINRPTSALFEIRGRDVFTNNNPLLGLRSSASEGQQSLHHPGPLLFYILAIPVRLLGGSAGIALGVVAIHSVVIALAVLAAHQFGGRSFAVAAAVSASLLCWTLGSDTVIDPWQPYILVIPFFALLVTSTAVVARKHKWLLAVVFCSFCA